MATTDGIFVIVIHHGRKYENHVNAISSSLRISFLHGMHCFQ